MGRSVKHVDNSAAMRMEWRWLRRKKEIRKFWREGRISSHGGKAKGKRGDAKPLLLLLTLEGGKHHFRHAWCEIFILNSATATRPMLVLNGLFLLLQRWNIKISFHRTSFDKNRFPMCDELAMDTAA